MSTTAKPTRKPHEAVPPSRFDLPRSTHRAGAEMADRQRQRHQHPPREMVAIDERAERVAARLDRCPEAVDLAVPHRLLNDAGQGEDDPEQTHAASDLLRIVTGERARESEQQQTERDGRGERDERGARLDREGMGAARSGIADGVASQHDIGFGTDPANGAGRYGYQLKGDRRQQQYQRDGQRSVDGRPAAALNQRRGAERGASSEQRQKCPRIDGAERQRSPGSQRQRRIDAPRHVLVQEGRRVRRQPWPRMCP
jgi:hypothetical protein